MNRIYPGFLDSLGRKEIDLEDDDLRLVLIDSSGSYDPQDEFLDDLGSVLVGTGVTVTDPVMQFGWLVAGVSTLTVTDAPASEQVSAAVLYVHTGTPSTSRLVGWVDTGADTTVIDLTTTGDDITLSLPYPLIAF